MQSEIKPSIMANIPIMYLEQNEAYSDLKAFLRRKYGNTISAASIELVTGPII